MTNSTRKAVSVCRSHMQLITVAVENVETTKALLHKIFTVLPGGPYHSDSTSYFKIVATDAELTAMHLSRSLHYAVRFSYAQNGLRAPQDRLVMHTALVLAGLGITLSSFSVKQLMSSRRQN